MPEFLNIQPLDIAVFVVLLLSAVLAYMRGAAREFFSLLAWGGTLVALYYGFEPLRPFAHQYIPVPLFADLATGGVIFMGSFILFAILTSQISSAIARSSHGAVDRSLGFLYGLVRGAVLVCVLYFSFSLFVPETHYPRWVMEARSRPLIEQGVDQIYRLLPAEVKSRMDGAGFIGTDPADDRRRAERLLERLNNPIPAQTKSTETAADTAGYKKRERHDLNRLIQGTK